MFTPPQLRASKLPHKTKAHIVADAKIAASAHSQQGESIADSALYVGLAYGVGFGVEQDMEECLSWISKSASQGSSAASLVLQILEYSGSRPDRILRAFKDSFHEQANSSGLGTCRFVHQDSGALDLFSFSSPDGCNPLHYLSLFEGLIDSENYLGSRWSILRDPTTKYTTIGSQAHLQRDAKIDPRTTEFLPGQRLGKIVQHLGTKHLHASTTTHYLHAHFPMTLSGTPLSFAISLDCQEAIKALLHAFDAPGLLRPSKYVAPEIEAAVSCHRPETFSLIWDYCMAIKRSNELFELFFCSEKGVHLIAALATRSPLERTILHGPNRSSMQTGIINKLINSLSDLADHGTHNEYRARLPFAKLMSEGVEQILELGDLEIAIEVMSSRALKPSLDKASRRRVFEVALQVACSGCHDLRRSKQFLDFSQDCGKDLNPDFEALKTMINHRSQSLFRACLEDGMDVSGCDENGRGLLHHMINTRSYSFVPMSLVISHGANPNHSCERGETPLHLAAKAGLPHIVKELLTEGANPLAADKTWTSVLLQAVMSRRTSVVAEILTALQEEVGRVRSRHSFTDSTQISHHFPPCLAKNSVFDYGVISRSDTEGSLTALQVAAQNHDLEIIRLLLYHGASPNARDTDGNVALHHAFLGTKNGASPNARDTDGKVAWHYAFLDAERGATRATSCCNILLEASKTALPRNQVGDTPLHLAAQRYEGENLRKLLTLFAGQQEFEIDTQNAQREIILHHAASQISDTSVAIIIAFGAVADQRNAEGRTALHLLVQAAAAVSPRLKRSKRSIARGRRVEGTLKALLDAGADPLIRDDSRNSGGYTAMEYAAMNSNDVLFFSMFDVACQNFRDSQTNQSSHDQTNPKQWLSSAWSLSIAEEQWDMVKGLLKYRPGFDADLSLLMWPRGVHLLKFAIAVHDGYLLTRFSQPVFDMLHARNIPTTPIDRTRNHHQRFDNTTPSLIRWKDLPDDLAPRPRSLSPGLTTWSSAQLRFWETSVQLCGVHQGGDPLNEIFDFMTLLDFQTFDAYCGSADHQRDLVNEKAFRWESCVDRKAMDIFAGKFLHISDYSEWRLWRLRMSRDENRRTRGRVTKARGQRHHPPRHPSEIESPPPATGDLAPVSA